VKKIEIQKIVRELTAELGLSSRNWLSGKECSRYLGYSEQHLSELVRAGTAPPSVLISKRARRFARADVDAWIRNGGATND
jgi:predicted DNA-binding transcriptional regulator AlpA